MTPMPVDGGRCDLVVVGSGAAGLSAALAASALGLSVVVVSKGPLDGGATALAQGGLAAALADDDSVADHVLDTQAAGAGLCRPDAVELLASSAPAEVLRLRELGARFDLAADGSLDLGREGGHRRRRIVHAGGDATGAEVQRTLVAAVRAAAGVTVLEEVAALDLVLDPAGRVGGVLVAEVAAGADDSAAGSSTSSAVLGPARLLRARTLLLATGGFGQAFAVTTNPALATGDGLAMALRAGAVARDLEFVQFHPTGLWLGAGSTSPTAAQVPLVSEAVRGEGARLVDALGAPVTAGAHPMGDLAPRDVVTTAIARRMAQAPGGVGDHVFLDATGLGRAVLERRFPRFVTACAAAGYDPAAAPVPVAPAAHFAVGGVAADLAGRTSVPGLLVAGEAAATGLHGANRLASNGVTEGLVAGRRAALAALADRELLGPASAEPLTVPPLTLVPAARRARLQAAMSRLAGPLRTGAGLAELQELLADLAAENRERQPAGYSSDSGGSSAAPTRLTDVETANLLLVARAVAVAAAERTESRGCHRRDDAPDTAAAWDGHLAVRLADGSLVTAFEPAGVPA